MTQTILTPNMILRRAQVILHQKMTFLNRVNRQYDNRYQESGGKDGDSIDIRLPNQYVTRTGATLTTQDIVERKVTLARATQKGVDFTFASAELTTDIDDFADRFLEPALAQLVSAMEADAFNMYKDVPQYAGTVTTQITTKSAAQAEQYIAEKLAPPDNTRTAILNLNSKVEFNDAIKGLFLPSRQIENAFTDGTLGQYGGYEFFESTNVPSHTTGTYGGSPLTNGANQGDLGTNNNWVETTSLITNGWTATTTILNKGDIITIGGVFDVHPETKVSIGRLKRFVVVSNTTTDGSGNSTFAISPAIIAGGAYQNASNRAATGQVITVLGTSATAYAQSLFFHRDAFVFASIDLEDVSKFGTWGARETYDGISMRIARQYQIGTDTVPCRLDVLYGYVTVRNQIACRLVNQVQ